MKKITLIFFFGLANIAGCSNDSAEKLQQFNENASSQIKLLAGNLQKELSTAMQSQGPVSAVSVCNLKAPEIADEINSSSPINVKRTSLKIRNPNNAPDDWERKVLNMFANQLQEGVPVSDLVYSERIDSDDSSTFRMMKAIPVQPVCLTCHGNEQVIIDDVKNIILTNYPNDKATGYAAGELRGAFSASQTIAN